MSNLIHKPIWFGALSSLQARHDLTFVTDNR